MPLIDLLRPVIAHIRPDIRPRRGHPGAGSTAAASECRRALHSTAKEGCAQRDGALGGADCAVCDLILEQRPHPEQGLASCAAVRRHASDARAIEIGALTYGSSVPSSTTSSIDTARTSVLRMDHPTSAARATTNSCPWKFAKFFDGRRRAIRDFFGVPVRGGRRGKTRAERLRIRGG
jgi:hypothetical protein